MPPGQIVGVGGSPHESLVDYGFAWNHGALRVPHHPREESHLTREGEELIGPRRI